MIKNRLDRFPRILGLLIVALATLQGCEQSPQLSRIQAGGELVVGTRQANTTIYRGANGTEGLEYELVTLFAESLGVKPRFVFRGDLQQLIDATRHGEVHMAAAGLSDTPARRRFLRFSSPYQEIKHQLVYRRGDPRPRSLDEIEPGDLHVIAGSSHVETLLGLRKQQQGLEWVARRGVRQEQLLREVNDGQLRLTVSDSHELSRALRVHRFLKPALDIGKPQQLAWAFPPGSDGSLRKAANRFLKEIKQNGILEQLLERYYAHTGRMNFVDRRDFYRHLEERLPRYRDYFLEAAEQTGLDWRLLAAIGYQESHWRPEAVSPTGVRGLMMLTRAAAKRVGVSKRTDPRQSILGGARYLKIVAAKIPARIQQPDHLWLTLAGYNVGFGHLEDARILTQRQGANPDLWMDVKERLPLLRKKKYHKTLKYGFARGDEAVNYVENIRNYYELLVWYENNPQQAMNGQ